MQELVGAPLGHLFFILVENAECVLYANERPDDQKCSVMTNYGPNDSNNILEYHDFL